MQYATGDKELDPDNLGGLITEVAPKDSCLVFCSNKKNCENVAILLTEVLHRYLKRFDKLYLN